jgi:hypothetical protein
MKTRLKNIITSIIGIVVMLTSSLMYFFGDLITEEYTMSLTEYLTLLFVGYIFLVAKDSLIQGILCNLLKIKGKK